MKIVEVIVALLDWILGFTKEPYREGDYEQIKRIDSDLNKYRERFIEFCEETSKDTSKVFSEVCNDIVKNTQIEDVLGPEWIKWLKAEIKAAKQDIGSYFNKVTLRISRDNDKFVDILKIEDAEMRDRKTKKFFSDEVEKLIDGFGKYVMKRWNQIDNEIQETIQSKRKQKESACAQTQGDLQKILDSKDEADKERKYLEMQCRISELEHLLNELNTLWQRLK